MFKIGEFSKLTNLTVRAIHHYEELGILLPQKIDSCSNYRYYSANQLPLVNQIKMLQQIGLPLKDIKKVLQSKDTKLLESYYQIRENEIRKDLAALQKKQDILNVFKEKMRTDDEVVKYNVEIKVLPKRKVMSIRKKVASFDDEHTLWQGLHEEHVSQQVKMSNPMLAVTIYHDQEYKEKDIEMEVQSSIVGAYENTDVVKFYETTECIMASVVFNGSYEQMSDITQAIASWLEVHDYEICGPMINISHVSPAQNPNPDNWVTEAGFVVCEC